uniref:Transposase n=1 Tax=Globodera rostochiensis TaxID=31243 RepID=A0A914H447_GLORO
MKAELTRAGFKNSYRNQLNGTVAKELGLSFVTIYKWKHELGQTTPQHKHSHSEQMELMKRYYEIKDKNRKINDKEIVKMLNIGIESMLAKFV